MYSFRIRPVRPKHLNVGFPTFLLSVFLPTPKNCKKVHFRVKIIANLLAKSKKMSYLCSVVEREILHG